MAVIIILRIKYVRNITINYYLLLIEIIQKKQTPLEYMQTYNYLNQQMKDECQSLIKNFIKVIDSNYDHNSTSSHLYSLFVFSRRKNRFQFLQQLQHRHSK